ncbi:MAG: hypothetical protein ACKVPY_08870 [Paracoccaceae bacterium]
MKIVYHVGSQCTDEDRLIRSLLKNRGALAQRGVAVPAPGRYRPVLRETLMALRGAPATLATQETLLDAILEGSEADRVILSHEYFLGIPSRVISPRGFHAGMGRKLAAIANLFPDTPCEFHMAVRNPATLVPALIGQINGASYASVLSDADPAQLRWEPAIADAVAAMRDLRLVVWCNEDSPILWPAILRRMAALPGDAPVEGANDLLAQVMSPEGFRRMEAYTVQHPPRSEAQRRKIAGAFLDKFALPEAVEVALPFPGWSESLVEEISRAYEADMEAVAYLPGVEVIGL